MPLVVEEDRVAAATWWPPPRRPSRRLPTCWGRNPGTFFPAGERPWVDTEDRRLYDQPRQICARCDLRARCLNLALAHGESLGVWGGTTPSERARLRLDALLPPVARRRAVEVTTTAWGADP